MSSYEQYYEKIWNHLAGTDNYLTSQSLAFIAQTKFSELCKKIYKEIQKEKRRD